MAEQKKNQFKVYRTVLGEQRVKFSHEGKDYDLTIKEAEAVVSALGLFFLFILFLALITSD